MQELLQYVISMAPALASIASAIGTVVVVGIKIKKSAKSTDTSVNQALGGLARTNQELKIALRETMEENAKLKKQLTRLLNNGSK